MTLWEPRQSAFRQELKALRERAGLTQAALAERLGRPQSFVSKYENGERRLEFTEVEAICSACGSSFINFVRNFTRRHPHIPLSHRHDQNSGGKGKKSAC